MRDLRISVTDRCNFRCSYCMPKERFGSDFVFLPSPNLLSFEELTRIARLFAGQGVTKLRLTGGEPLLRHDLERLVEQLAQIDGIADIALTTNGALLAARAHALAAAGLSRVTISLDALDDDVFGAMNSVKFPVSRVLASIEAAADAGLTPIKVNMVVRRGVNEHCILPMASHFRHTGKILRFIEYMDVGTTNHWSRDDVVPAAVIRRTLDATWPLEPLERLSASEVATRFRYRDGAGEIGLIASVTQPFCGSCTRARLSADGKLHTCLFATEGHSIRALLRGGASDAEISDRVRAIWTSRTDHYSETRSGSPTLQPRIEMSYIGG